jgi:ATP-dependent protease ClpP protease subunit
MNIQLPGKAASFQASQREHAEKQRQALGVEARSWYRITNAASPDEAEVMLYDEVGGWLGATADEFIADLRGITAPNLRVRVNSPGGSVFEGIAIANALRSHPAQVTVQVDGIAASIASVIAMAGDRIEMAPNTMLMIHDATSICMGNAADMDEMAELLDLISDNIADAYAARAGGTRDEWRARMKAETWYLPEDAVAAGLADEAVQTPKAGTPAEPDEDDEPDMHRAYDLAAYGYTGPCAAEQPKAEAEPTTVTLTFNVGDTIDEEILATLRRAVARRDEPAAPPVEDTAAVEPVAEATPAEPAPEPAAPEPEAPTPYSAEAWAALTAGLMQPPPDPWAAAVAHLINSTSAASSATEAA